MFPQSAIIVRTMRRSRLRRPKDAEPQSRRQSQETRSTSVRNAVENTCLFATKCNDQHTREGEPKTGDSSPVRVTPSVARCRVQREHRVGSESGRKVSAVQCLGTRRRRPKGTRHSVRQNRRMSSRRYGGQQSDRECDEDGSRSMERRPSSKRPFAKKKSEKPAERHQGGYPGGG